MKFCTTLLIGTLNVCLSAAAQDTQGKLPESEIALLRADIQTKKMDILQQNLTPSDEQGKTFWPLQRRYYRSRDRVFNAANQIAQSPVDAAGLQA
jgi:hypothetical protein